MYSSLNCIVMQLHATNIFKVYKDIKNIDCTNISAALTETDELKTVSAMAGDFVSERNCCLNIFCPLVGKLNVVLFQTVNERLQF